MCKVLCNSIGSTHLCDGCGASKPQNYRFCEPCPANNSAKCLIVPSGNIYMILGTPVTVGELKKLIEKYPDDTSFGFRNQPIQNLCHVEHGNDINVVFQL